MNGLEILLGAGGGALIVVGGAAYALLFALGRLRNSAVLNRAAWAAYGALVAGTTLLAHALRLDGVWLLLIATLLAGYLLAPRAIWHLSVATHGEHDTH